MSTAEFTRASCDVACRDVWALEGMRPSALQAYKRLDARGDIVMLYPVVFFPARCVVTYLAAVPVEWVHDVLRAEEEAIVAEAQRRRDELAQTLCRMVETLTVDQVPAFDALAGEYLELVREGEA